MDRERFRKEKWLYHALPLVAVMVLLWVFVGVEKLSHNNQAGLLAGLTASALVMWRWKASARWLETWACPKCGRRLSRQASWAFPPRKCPNCGEPTP